MVQKIFENELSVLTSWIRFCRSQTAGELNVSLYWQQTMKNVRLVSDMFKQCSTLFNAPDGELEDVSMQQASSYEMFPRISWNTRR